MNSVDFRRLIWDAPERMEQEKRAKGMLELRLMRHRARSANFLLKVLFGYRKDLAARGLNPERPLSKGIMF